MKVTADTVWGFSEGLLKDSFDNPQPTPDFHRELWEYCCSDKAKVAIAAPRGHAKSTAVTLAYLLAVLLFRERKYAIIISETESQSKYFLHDIKKTLMRNDKLRSLFGVKGFLKETETEIVVEMSDGHTFRVVAKGSGQSLRGQKADNARPDIVIGDDLEGDDQVGNEERRYAFRIWFYGVVLPMMSDTGIVRIVGTIMHMDALLERLMPESQVPEGIDPVPHLQFNPLSVKSTFPASIWYSVRYRAHDTSFENILWPTKFTKERLLAIRQDYVNQGMPEAYSKEYLNYPVDAETAYFKAGDFKPFSRDLELGANYVALDLAISTKARRNWSAFVVAGMTSRNILRIEHVVRKRIDSLEIANLIFELHSHYNPECFIVERGAIWAAIKPLLDRMSQETGVYPIFKDYPVTQDKEARAQSIRARMRAGAVEFNTNASWYATLFEEMTQFPRAANDDQVDAMAWLGIALNDILTAPSQEEIEEDIYQRDYQEYLEQDNSSMSLTGY